MRATSRLYHRTEAGERELKRSNSRLGAQDFALLASIEGAMRFETVGVRTSRALERLEAAGMVESVDIEWLRELYRLGAYEPEPICLSRRTASPRSS